jgi:RimJ/RimL family protein N-acetyltransferase
MNKRLMKTYIETENIILRRFTQNDDEVLFDLDSDPEVMRFISDGVPTELGDIQNKLLPYILDYYEKFSDYGFWCAHEKSNNYFIGWFHFRPDKTLSDTIELGYRIKREFWGRGYATEVSKELIEHGFSSLGVETISARTMKENLASARVLEKLGFQCQGDYTEDRFFGTNKLASQYILSKDSLKLIK